MNQEYLALDGTGRQILTGSIVARMKELGKYTHMCSMIPLHPTDTIVTGSRNTVKVKHTSYLLNSANEYADAYVKECPNSAQAVARQHYQIDFDDVSTELGSARHLAVVCSDPSVYLELEQTKEEMMRWYPVDGSKYTSALLELTGCIFEYQKAPMLFMRMTLTVRVDVQQAQYDSVQVMCDLVFDMSDPNNAVMRKRMMFDTSKLRVYFVETDYQTANKDTILKYRRDYSSHNTFSRSFTNAKMIEEYMSSSSLVPYTLMGLYYVTGSYMMLMNIDMFEQDHSIVFRYSEEAAERPKVKQYQLNVPKVGDINHPKHNCIIRRGHL